MEKYLEPFTQMLSLTRKPDFDFIHEFLGFKIHKSTVKVEIWKQDDKAIIVFTDTGIGTSITNAAEQVITEIYHKYLSGYPVGKLIFCETYDKHKDGIDYIDPTWVKKGEMMIVEDVNWKHIGKILKK